MNVSEAILTWVEYRDQMMRLSLVAASTFGNQRQIARGLVDTLGDHALEKLRKSHIELWMGERLRSCSPVTVRGEMNVLRQILRWCVDEGHLVAAPRFPKLSVPNTEAALPSDEAFLWVLAHVPPQHAAALEFMMLTGLSPHELERVQVQDMRLDVAHGQAHYRLGIGQRADFPVKQPSRRRFVPLNGRAHDLWFQRTAGTDRGNPFPSVAAMQKAIRRAVPHIDPRLPTVAAVYAGAGAITPKLMRKWFASKVAGQQPEHVLQRLMGHAPGSPITRRHYVRSNDEQAHAAVADVRA